MRESSVAENEGERRWVVEPPAPGEVSFHMAFGEGVDLTEEQEAALSELMRTLETNDAEVTGLAANTKCSAYSTCTDKSCKPVRCSTFVCHGLTAQISAAGGGAWNLMGSFSPGQA
jgi:hypothetical protein